MRGVALSLAMLLAACGSELTPEERAAKAERDTELVKRANAVLPPVEEITPDAITYVDMERHDIGGVACNYAPGTSLGTRVIARPADAFMKLDGEVVRFSADSGADMLPAQSRSRYLAGAYELRLRIESASPDEEALATVDDAAPAPGSAESASSTPARAGEQVNYEGTVSLRDSHGRIVYEGTGLAQCG